MTTKFRQHNSSASESTIAVHGGKPSRYAQDSLTPPIYDTSTYSFPDTASLCAYQDEESPDRDEYGRYGNPSVRACENRLAALDKGETSVLFSSGMGAVTGTLLTLLKAGDHMIIGADCYRRTRQFCLTTLAGFGIETSVVPMGDYQALERAIRPHTKLIFSESPTNPYLRVVDLEKIVDIAEAADIYCIIDSTFATPINQKPLEYGVDLVIHSATKYLGGHNDLLAGVVTGRKCLVDLVRAFRGIVGGIPDGATAARLDKHLQTLCLRVERQNSSAQKIAEYLSTHSMVTKVWYPGLSSHPDHEIARRQMKGFGGVISFEIAGSLEATAGFIDSVKIPKIAPSLGGVESLIEQPAIISFYELTTEERLKVGIKDSLVRFSIGIEDPNDLIEDLAQALDHCRQFTIQSA